MARLAVLSLVAAIVAAGTWAYRRWQTRLVVAAEQMPEIPVYLRESGRPTWVVFSTPLCATCGPVTDRLRASQPDAVVHKIDATEYPHLAEQFSVRAAPTVIRADIDGRVDFRVVGAAAANEAVGKLVTA